MKRPKLRVPRLRFGRCSAILLVAVLAIVPAPASGQDPAGAHGGATLRNAFELFPPGPLVGLYSVQYLREFSPGNHLILGLAYVNVENDVGQFFSPTLPVGYRRDVRGKVHAEFQLWPARAVFFEKEEREFYRGFDLYAEARAGYTFDVPARGIPLILTLQYVFGFGIYPGNKPDSFTEWAEDNPYFHSPIFLLGFRF